MTDLWPEELVTLEITPPSSILREQGALLAKKTKGLVEGRVDVARDLQTPDRFAIDFFLFAPNLDEYRCRLLHVNHPVEYYPLKIVHDSAVYHCQDEGQFLQNLQVIFNLDQTKRTIGALMKYSGAEIAEEKNGKHS